MNTTKRCPQCGTDFKGQSKRLYCSDRCKVEAFRAGKAGQSNAVVVAADAPPIPVVVTSQPVRAPRPAPRTDTARSAKINLERRRLELEHACRLKQMDLDEAERIRAYEQNLTRIKADERGREDQLQALSQQVEALQQRAIRPLEAWSHYPVGIRRRYQALVRAALRSAEEPLSALLCSQWLEEHEPYSCAVQDLIAHNGILTPNTEPFSWLADLADQIEAHRRANDWPAEKQGGVLILSSELRQRLMQASV